MMLKLKKWAMPFLFLLMLAPAWLHAVAAPTGLATSPWANGGSFLSWTDDPTVQQWFIYLNAQQLFTPPRSQVSVSGTGRVGFQLTGIAQGALPVVASMRAISGGGLSGYSAGVTITAVGPVPFVYVQTAPGTSLSTTGGGGGGGGAASAVTVISSVLPTNASTSGLQTTGNSTLTTINSNLSNVTVNAHAVTQGGPWTVSGSVTTNPSGAYQGVSVFSGVAGLTVTASQGGPFTVSGSVSVTNLTGVTVNTHAVTQGGPWTVSGSVSTVPSGAYQGVSVFAGVAGLTVTASQGSPWTVSGSVGVTSGVAGISVTASQGSPFTVSGSVSVTNLGSVTITGTVSGNQTQINGVAISTDNGVSGTGVQRMVIASNNTPFQVGISHTVAVSATNLSTNVAQMNGVATSMGSGVNGTGVQRVTLATDQAYTGVSVTSMVALPANQSVNVAQMNGVATTMGNGVAGTGVQRVVFASDNTANSNPWLINQTQVNGIAVSTGNGVAGTGVQRITIAQDNAALAVTATGDVASGVADSGNPVKVGGVAKTALPTAVSDGQRVNGILDKSGRRLARMSPRERLVITTTNLANTTETTIMAAGSAGVFRDIVHFSISNSGTNNNTVTIKDATAGTTRFVFNIASQGGGAVSNFSIPVPQAVAASNWTATLTSTPTSGSVSVNVLASEDN